MSTDVLGLELHFHVEIPRVIFLRFGRYAVVNVMVKKERNELIERHAGKVN